MHVTETARSQIARGLSFVRRQPRDWKVTVARTSLHRFVEQMLIPYQSIFIIGLGTSATGLGIVNSAGMGVAALSSPFAGWLIDRIGTRRIYLIGISLLALAYVTYSLAQTWTVAILAMVAYWLGFSTSILGCATICGNSLANKDRATGMMLCETVAAGLLGMAGPLIGSRLVAGFGGANVAGIRPLYFVGLAVTAGTFLLVFRQLSDCRYAARRATPNLFKDLGQVLKEGRHLKRWLVVASVTQLPLGMIFPFAPLFAYQFKGADPYVLGAMAAGAALTSIVMAIPLGRLADRVGRKKVLYIGIPLFWASNLLLLWAPVPGFLIAAGILQGFYHITAPLTGAIERELVPAEHMGRWLGISRFVKMLFNACLAFLSGLIWDRLGPQYVFLTFIALDVFLRMPLLISMPETLGLGDGRDRAAPG